MKVSETNDTSGNLQIFVAKMIAVAKRISTFYMMGFVANAFSGLIAYRYLARRTFGLLI